jgi:hypothetical protein
LFFVDVLSMRHGWSEDLGQDEGRDGIARKVGFSDAYKFNASPCFGEGRMVIRMALN